MKSKKQVFVFTYVTLFAIYIIWWWLLRLNFLSINYTDYYADTYGILAGLGGLAGLYVTKNWGFYKSYVGKGLIFLSLGLFSQFLGQLTYTVLYYIYHVENAYPSFGEIFFLLSIPCYILGTFFLGKASGFTIPKQSLSSKLIAFFLPLSMIAMSYFLFLRGYEFADVPLVNVLLDFSYPIGQALFVSSAILTFYMTRNTLGGVMKNKVIFILFSLVFQYIADTLFIYETRAELWNPGGTSDLIFVISYFLMTLGLVAFQVAEIEKSLKGGSSKS